MNIHLVLLLKEIYEVTALICCNIQFIILTSFVSFHIQNFPYLSHFPRPTSYINFPIISLSYLMLTSQRVIPSKDSSSSRRRSFHDHGYRKWILRE